MSRFAHPLLDLTDEEALLLDPIALALAERRALREFATTRRFTKRQWNWAVDEWNDLTPAERQARHAVCVRTKRHRWVALPMDDCWMCARCVAYKVEKEGE